MLVSSSSLFVLRCYLFYLVGSSYFFPITTAAVLLPTVGSRFFVITTRLPVLYCWFTVLCGSFLCWFLRSPRFGSLPAVTRVLPVRSPVTFASLYPPFTFCYYLRILPLPSVSLIRPFTGSSITLCRSCYASCPFTHAQLVYCYYPFTHLAFAFVVPRPVRYLLPPPTFSSLLILVILRFCVLYVYVFTPFAFVAVPSCSPPTVCYCMRYALFALLFFVGCS